MYKLIAVALLLGPMAAHGEVEVGTIGGLVWAGSGGRSASQFSLVGGGPLGVSVLYVASEVAPKVMMQVQGNLVAASSSGLGYTVGGSAIVVAGQLDLMVQEGSSPFVGGGAALVSASGGGSSDSLLAIGAEGGYRALVGETFVLRFEGRLRRWLNDGGINELGITGSAGVIF
jgi:hypothetical protein